MNTTDFGQLGFLRVAAVSPQITIGDVAANTATICQQLSMLANDGVAIGVFPELCLTGYSAEDLFFSESLLQGVRQSLTTLCHQSPLPLLAVGAPWRLADGRLINAAVLIGAGRILGMVPKTYLPNYGEFYDQRWFSSGFGINETEVSQDLGTFHVRADQLFQLGDLRVGVEICEDLWAPISPGTQAALAGARVLLNLSASNELISKAEYRRDLVRMTSASNLCAYVYAGAGALESSKDIVFGGHCLIAEAGVILAEGERFSLQSQMIYADLDSERLAHDRGQNKTFSQSPRPTPYRIVSAGPGLPSLTSLCREFSQHPFVPDDEDEVAARAQEVLSIQATGLARRMQAAGTEKLVIGLSGGLDSTLAVLVARDALEKLELPGENLCALTLPGPGTSGATLANAKALADALEISLQVIPIDAAVTQHLDDLSHTGDHDVVYENAQARERTQILFNHANQIGGIVTGTGDLSELALGWCTFNADHMANYNVNASVPKTMIAYLVRWYAQHRSSAALSKVLGAVLETPFSPELIPPDADQISQLTEDLVGPYELHDFFLYHFLRNGSGAKRIFSLACLAFGEQYPAQTIKHWLGQFFKRFMTQQFKRTTLPPGPKVGSVSLSPRGDWRMPDEAGYKHILEEIENLL